MFYSLLQIKLNKPESSLTLQRFFLFLKKNLAKHLGIMSQPDFTLKFKSEDLKFLKICIILYAIADFMDFLETTDIQIGEYQLNEIHTLYLSTILNIIAFLLTNFLLYGLFIFYKKYKDTFSNKKIFYLFIGSDVLVFISFIIDFVDPFPSYFLTNTLTLNMSKNLADFKTIFFIEGTLSLFADFFYVLFAYYFINWYNASFSVKTYRMKSFFIASLVGFISSIIDIFANVYYFFLNGGSKAVTDVTPNLEHIYSTYLSILNASVILFYFSIIIELFACFYIYRRFNNIIKGRNYFHNFQIGMFPPINQPMFAPPNNQQIHYQDFIYCTNCGTKIPPISDFCLNCGMKIQKY